MSIRTASETRALRTSGPWTTYRLFGLTLASDFPFANRLAPGDGAPELTFTRVLTPPIEVHWDRDKAAYASPYRTEEGESIAYLHRLGQCDVLRFTNVADFYLWPERIVCHLLDPGCDYLVEIYLLGAVLSFWLERQGLVALHASAVVMGGNAVAFVSSNSGGKSALAAMLVQAGYPLLTDDILPVRVNHGACVGRPGYPQMRMWPDEAQYFLGHYEDLPLVHPAHAKRRVSVGEVGLGSFCDQAQPVACFYLPERYDPAGNELGIAIEHVSRRDALIELVRDSLAAGVIKAIGREPQRLDLLSQIVRRVPMRRLVYPSGFEYLPRVREAILQDLARLL